jgi:MarR family transcriptional regulator, transcriptional regulator for hemolysin
MDNHDLFHTINQLSRNVTNQINEALKPFGLFSSQWTVIYVLHKKGSMTQKELSNYLSIEAPPMTRTIQRLVKQGYVKQITGKDKREKYIQLTEEAFIGYPHWEATILKINQSLLSKLPEHSREDIYQSLSVWLKNLS